MDSEFLQDAKAMAAKAEQNMGESIGRLRVLEAFDEYPVENRSELLYALSAYHSLNMARFFRMIQDEYGEEYAEETTRALKKIKMAGFNAEGEAWFNGKFLVGLSSATRHMGVCGLSVFWETAPDRFCAEHFVVHFNSGGISNFILAEDIEPLELKAEILNLKGLVPLNLRECRLLLTEAYENNRRQLLRPSLGHFLYKRYLLDPQEYTMEDMIQANRKITLLYTEQEVANSLFLGLKNQDEHFVLSLTDEKTIKPAKVLQYFSWRKIPGVIFLEAKTNRCYKKRVYSYAEGSVLVYEKQHLKRYDYEFRFKPDPETKRLRIDAIHEESLAEDCIFSGVSPLKKKVYVRVYTIVDMEDLLNGLNDLEQVQKIGELPCGLHLRIVTTDDTLLYEGVNLLTGIVADFIVSNEEFIVLSDSGNILEEFSSKFADCVDEAENYEVDLKTYIRYFQGQYDSFEEFMAAPEDAMPQDPMRFVSACYTVINEEKLLAYIASKSTFRKDLPDDRILFYEMADLTKPETFEAEYLMDGTYFTASSFGDEALEALCWELEENLAGVLHYEHTEVNPNGFFELLIPDLKGSIPELEAFMKKIYLARWYKSPCAVLKGMSPREAMKTAEGQKLLWQMLKWMRERESWFSAGCYADITIREFLSKLEENE